MKRFTRLIISLSIVMTVLWYMAEPAIFSFSNFFQWRSALIQYSGILSIILMSLTMLLALRLSWIEKLTGGIDKSYIIHKWVGITAVALGGAHWLFYQVPKWLVSWDILTRPQRGHRGQGLDGFALWVSENRRLGVEMGEWGFYFLLLLLGISLWTLIRYKPFRLSHRLMSVAYLMLAFHSVVLFKRSYFGTPLFYVTLIFIVVGSIAAIYSILGFVGRGRHHSAHIKEYKYCPDGKILDLRLDVDGHWPGHSAGQFAYLRFGNEDPHPFTIVSSNDGHQLRFLIKELGDFTTGLHKRIEIGKKVKIEGPYGCFAFNEDKPQIWIAGGIGIAPFYAELERYSQQPTSQPVHLFFSCRGFDSVLLSEVKLLAQKGGVSLHVIDTQKSERLTVDTLVAYCGGLSDYEFYFCGPTGMSKAIRQSLKDYHIDTQSHFHEENYVMR